MRPNTFLAFAGIVVAVVAASVLWWPKERAVTVYCSADDIHALPVLQAFEAKTGIKVHKQFDTEASKTVGLVQRLRDERDRVQCDVFWNNEPMHTMRLANEGLFAPYDSPSAKDIPAEFKDPERRWTGFAGRARILMVNTGMVKPGEMPATMDDLLDPKWSARIAFPKPVAGTGLTHSIVLCSVLGPEKASAWFKALIENRCSFPSGNGPVATSVAEGQNAIGFTDTDDFRKCQAEGKPVASIFPDQAEGRPGALILPNTVALMKGAPEPELARQLIDYLLSEEVEAALAASDGAHIPLRGSVKRPPHVKGPPEVRAMKVDWAAVIRDYDAHLATVRAATKE